MTSLKKVNALITGSGGGVAISIIKAAKLVGYKIIAIDMKPLSAGLLRSDRGYLVPKATSPDYITKLIEICRKENVDVLIPGSDPELPVIASNKEQIEEKTSTVVVVGTREAVETGRSKYKTYRFLKKSGFPYCESALKKGALELAEKVEFPLVVKPDTGSGSVDSFIANDKDELDFYVKQVERRGWVPLIQKCLQPPDEEYTTGVMFSKDCQLIGSITLWRRLKKGSSYVAISEDFPRVRLEMERVAKELHTPGPLNLQCRLTDRGPVIFEINPRFSGTTAVRAVLGFNDVKFVVENFLFDVMPEKVSYKKGVAMVRYLNEVYIEEEGLEDLRRRKHTREKGFLKEYF